MFLFFSVAHSRRTRLAADYAVDCASQTYRIWAYGVASICFPLFAIGIPVYAVLRIRRARLAGTLQSLDNRIRFSFLCRGYKSQYAYWEAIVVVRKLAVVLLQAVMTQDIHAQALCVQIVLCVALLVHVWYEPFEMRMVNNYETVSIVSSIVLVIAMQFLFSFVKIEVAGAGAEMRREGVAIFAIFVILAFTATFIFAVRIARREEKKKAKIAKQGGDEDGKL
jgi:hypothetical protein